MREPVDRFSRRLPWAALALVLLAIAAIRVRVLDVPLERDEGEYAYIGSLLLHGIAPWAEAWNMKLPGIYAVYAILVGVGGASVSAIHAGLLVANTWNALACAFLARRLFGDGAAVVAGSAYAAMSLSTAVLGLWSHAEPFALAFALGGLMLALEARSAAALAGAGLLFGAAVLVKQNAAPLALFGAAWAAWQERSTWARAPAQSLRRLASLAAAALLLPAAVALALLHAGVFGRFWFWTVTYASWYGAQLSLGQGVSELAARLPILLRAQAVWWVAAAVGLAAPLWSAEVRARAPFLLGLLAAGCAAASLGFYYRPQYFVLLLPALALLAGAAAHALAPRTPRARALACTSLAVAGLLTPIGVEAPLLLRAGRNELSRAVYGPNPFPEAVVLAREIAARTALDARIGVIGSEPELYFYSGRRAATGYVYTYALMEPQPYAQAMQEEMIAELRAARPEMLVFVNVPMSWLGRPESPRALVDWFAEVSTTEYETVCVADILSSSETRYVFGDAARSYAPRSPYWVSLLRRKAT
jgi:hypothetical protein